MRKTATLKIIMAGSLTLGLLIAIFMALPPGAYPAQAGGLYQSGGSLSIVKLADTGQANHQEVWNGHLITYTIIVTNNGSTPATNVQLVDSLPPDTLNNLQCAETCQLIAGNPVTVTDVAGKVFTIAVTTQISWTVASLAPGQAVARSFSARVVCQADGNTFTNSALVFSDQDPVARISQAQTTVRVPLEQSGQPVMSIGPTWCSPNSGSTFDLDWGDFDGDGDLDLALASASLGVDIYRNEAGQLTLLRRIAHNAYGLRWADFNRNGFLDLVVVGESLNNQLVSTGTNYIYSYNNNIFVESTFTSSHQLFRVAPGDYDNDGYLDLVASTTSFETACKVFFFKNEAGQFTGPGECIPQAEATANISPADFDNDGDLDLALGQRLSRNIRIFTNNSHGVFSSGPVVDAGYASPSDANPLPYDLAWGDYDGDGYLDLAAAFPRLTTNQVRVYHNNGNNPFTLAGTIPIDESFSPIAVDWGDFNGDGKLELAVADPRPRIYNPSTGFTPIFFPPVDTVPGQVWRIRGVDYDNDGDLDLSASNRDGASLLFTNFAPLLTPHLTSLGSFQASNVAWGDADADGDLDLLFGAGPDTSGGNRLALNHQGRLASPTLFGQINVPQYGAFGDVNGDGTLEMVFGANTWNQTSLYLYTGPTLIPSWSLPQSLPIYTLAWGDANDDGALDLLAGSTNATLLYLNQGGQLGSTPVWSATETGPIRSVAWMDYNHDFYPDFAAGGYNQPVRVYLNNKNNTFSLAWSTAEVLSATSVAWADYDGDGDQDLAVGNYNGPNEIYHNTSGAFSRVWTAPDSLPTTALAWGDWDNDGDPDLAVGTNGQANRVYSNETDTPGSPQLTWRWTSAEASAATGLAWGDYDGDGDLDLAVSGSGPNGVYENSYVTPAHGADEDDFTRSMPLPNNPTYLSLARPGHTQPAYFFSSAEILGSPTITEIAIPFTLFDPDGTRHTSADAYGDDIIPGGTTFEYSLDGGGTWQTAHGRLVYADTPSSDVGYEDTSRQGKAYTFWWKAQQDEAVSNDARFRIQVIHHLGSLDTAAEPKQRTGLAQRASTAAVSPPFRVRATTCLWPDQAALQAAPSLPQINQAVRFTGSAAHLSQGTVYFMWDFGDGSAPYYGQSFVQHTYTRPGLYRITLTVRVPPCPVARDTVANLTLSVGGVFTGTNQVYLPLVQKRSSAGATAFPAPVETWPDLTLTPGSPAQVTDLAGSDGPGLVRLTWPAGSPADQVWGYHIYRSAQTPISVQRLGSVPAAVTTYTDPAAACGQMYYVTAYNAAGESLPSRATYFNTACQENQP